MKNKFKINVKKESFYLNEGGAVIGDICFSFADWYFPDKDWDDFVVVMLAWLAQEIVKLSFDKNKIADAPFMEGCFKITLTLDKQDECDISFIEGEKLAGDKEIVHKKTTLPFEAVKSEVLKACELLLKMKESKELNFEKDYKELKKSYELLCKC
uniref:Uncharacterized protein n=1 Tax=Candidatus Kentrum sp. SD TaxID=2126332 RepID=A0A451BRC1_9GAMM|nr:MAG: hypothetical protein BECKSD772F_GA0070984_11528 [Candidatus Kentron sp. SD]VFK44465.1 MAG: hypothetical protein BECKSD772E_GA0070983_103812 [Candidatus Kentron sp. SD]VFK80842.1 MAG: hypothetical protein BECKSD772D_GA0070982_11653 [Candidatus Kentron sp. SD]